MMTLNALVKQRTKAVSKIFESIDGSKEILRVLEDLATSEAQGHMLDLGAITDKVHELRGLLDQVLVGFVESRAYWDEGSNVSKGLADMVSKKKQELEKLDGWGELGRRK